MGGRLPGGRAGRGPLFGREPGTQLVAQRLDLLLEFFDLLAQRLDLRRRGRGRGRRRASVRLRGARDRGLPGLLVGAGRSVQDES
ncbi:MAG: hypothetical protein DMF50_05175 [Acidobacteria bacterium]|nr:MAG: hypothetical protein DMF50_05175 [Acidobacteriota bacterium]